MTPQPTYEWSRNCRAKWHLFSLTPTNAQALCGTYLNSNSSDFEQSPEDPIVDKCSKCLAKEVDGNFKRRKA